MKYNSEIALSECVYENKKSDSCFSVFNIFKSKKKKVVAVIRLAGVIGRKGFNSKSLSLESVQEQLDQVAKIKNLAGLCLCINSPGGSPVQSELISLRIRQMFADKVPIYSFIEDIAASGGYWLACAADEIYASRSSIIGSIGVIAAGFGLDKMIEKIGIERRVYSCGEHKSILDPFKPENPSDVEIIQNLQNQVFDHFVDYVRSMRKSRLNQDDGVLFSGRVWAGQSAMDMGLIDGISDLYTTINAKFGDNVDFKHIKSKTSIFKRYLGAEKRISQDIIDYIEFGRLYY